MSYQRLENSIVFFADALKHGFIDQPAYCNGLQLNFLLEFRIVVFEISMFMLDSCQAFFNCCHVELPFRLTTSHFTRSISYLAGKRTLSVLASFSRGWTISPPFSIIDPV